MNQKSYSLISDNNMGFPPHHHPFLFNPHQDTNDHLPSPSSLPSCPPQLFPGSGGGHYMMKRSMSFSGMERCDQEGVHGDMDDLSDDGSNLGEKKKRLNLEQVKALEKSFELGNKLEPERKIQLAKALGLQPRQIAIWFQNRRARWKTKQLEKDYEVLKKQFDSLKADNDNLQSQNKKLHAELQSLKGSRDSTNEGSNPKKEAEGTSWSNGSDQNSCDVNLDISRNISRNISRTASPPPPPPHNNNNNNNSSQQLSTRHLFSSPSTNVRPTTTTNMTQLFHGSSRSSVDHHHHHHLAVHHQDHHHHPENFSSMFINGIEEQQGLIWAWPDQNQQQNTSFSLSQPQFTNN